MNPWRLANMALIRTVTVAALVTLFVAVGNAPAGGSVQLGLRHSTAYAAGGCSLNAPGGATQHVIHIQFDNVHFTRDNPNVPSDLEQMPHLLNFIKSNGTLITHEHTPLISHTSVDILTSLTGLYGDRQGMQIGNSFEYYGPDGTPHNKSSFVYWTDPVSSIDKNYEMITPSGANTPAPWVPYTRAGCNFGSVSMANTALENTAGDIMTVFGPSSPQASEVTSNPDQAYADFVGVAVHCAQGSALCSTANGGEPDVLPSEPGGYSGFNALFGHKYVVPQISPSGPLTDLNGQVITNADSGLVGFPGFDPTAAQSLSYVAAMQEHGVPVTYAYIADAHDRTGGGDAFGPGEAGYVAQLKSYDSAFATFFARLQNDGITPQNTLFVITADEGDHYVGGAPSPAGCDGVTTPCTYSKIGELQINLANILAKQQGITTPFDYTYDMAPNVYLNGQPARDAAAVRAFERATASLTAANPITGTTDTLAWYLADPVELKLLHMVNGDPARTPTFTMFADPDYWFASYGGNCNPNCVLESAGHAWNHGGVAAEINTTFLGLVGPGVRQSGVDNATWSDHTDIRPTMMALLGLKDDYNHDGRVLYEDLVSSAIPAAVQSQIGPILALGRAYKQLTASVGEFDLATLRFSTTGLASGSSASDATYSSTENRLTTLGNQRDALASQISALLEGAEFNGTTIDPTQAQSLIRSSWFLIQQVLGMAGGVGFEVSFRSNVPGQGEVLFGPGPGCNGLVMVATQDQGAGTIEHRVFVSGNDLPGTVGNIGITPGATYWYEMVTNTPNGPQIDNNGGSCYSVTIPGP